MIQTAYSSASLVEADTMICGNPCSMGEIRCVSTEILEEYAEKLQQFTSNEFTEAALGVITNNPHTLFVTPYYHFNLISVDPDDNKFVDCAVVANAKFVVTDDGHFDVLKQIDFPKVNIIGLDDVIRTLK